MGGEYRGGGERDPAGDGRDAGGGAVAAAAAARTRTRRRADPPARVVVTRRGGRVAATCGASAGWGGGVGGCRRHLWPVVGVCPPPPPLPTPSRTPTHPPLSAATCSLWMGRGGGIPPRRRRGTAADIGARAGRDWPAVACHPLRRRTFVVSPPHGGQPHPPLASCLSVDRLLLAPLVPPFLFTPSHPHPFCLPPPPPQGCNAGGGGRSVCDAPPVGPVLAQANGCGTCGAGWGGWVGGWGCSV